jgi:hypothetical protein
MRWLRILILVLTVIEAGWMAFDGSRALIVGQLITPSSGPHAGQVGPWQHLVRRVGINPTGTAMQIVFAVYGWAWLAVALAFAFRRPGSWTAMLVAATGALWFLPLGTVCSLVQIALLVAARSRLTS